jgi:Ca2+-binding RTX toxin-like protein
MSCAPVEPLESRQHFAATLPVALEGGWDYRITSNGTLLIQGSSEGGEVVLEKNPKSVRITTNGRPTFAGTVVPSWQFKRIVVEGGGGRDTISAIGDFDKAVYLLGGKGNDTIVGGPGQHLSGDDGADHITMGKVPVSPPSRILGPDGEIITIIDIAGPRSSVAFGGEGDDTILASAANDTVSGGGGTDLLLIKGIPGRPMNLNDPLQGGSVDAIEQINYQPQDPPRSVTAGGFNVIFINDKEARERARRDAFSIGGNVINGWRTRLEQEKPRVNWIFG